MDVIFHRVTFAYDGSPTDIVHDLSAHFPAGWTGVVGANGAGKSTVLQLAAGLLQPLAGTVQNARHTLYCPQRTDVAPDGLPEFLDDHGADAHVLRRRLAVADDWQLRWHTLSHGERKRAQLAVALWRQPDVLAIDEPTNHLDEEARQQLERALQTFGGVGILVSHDRSLLDGLCGRCLFLEPGAATMRPGGYTEASQEKVRELEAARQRHELAATEVRRLRRLQTARRSQADQAKAKRSARDLARHDSDGRAKLRLAVVTGKDGQAGHLLAQLDGRLRHAQEQLAQAQVAKTQRHGIWLPGARSPRRTVLELPAGSCRLGERMRSTYPPLALGPQDRVALTGANGAGKTTLLRRLLDTSTLPPGRLVDVPQEITAEQSARLLEEALAMDDATLGRLLTVVSRLGSQPDLLLTSRLPSPGETRKLMLALGILREPHLVVMDEPTNHLDLPAIESLEDALAEAPCALLLVSHDRHFLGRLCTTEWHLQRDDGGFRLHVRPMKDPCEEVQGSARSLRGQ